MKKPRQLTYEKKALLLMGLEITFQDCMTLLFLDPGDGGTLWWEHKEVTSCQEEEAGKVL